MILNCAAGDNVLYYQTFGVVFKQTQVKTLSPASMIVTEATAHDPHVADTSKDTPASTIQTEIPGNTKTPKKTAHRSFFDDSVKVALVSAVSIVGVLGATTVLCIVWFVGYVYQ